MNEYEQKQASRKERLLEIAERMQAASDAAYQQARRMASVIPLGQPILVGHHSEKRDRNYRARIWRTQDRCLELQRKAEYFRRKAAGVGTGGISSDDPEAIDKLRAQLADLEKMQDTMKKANALVRRQDRASLAALGFSEARIAKLFEPDFCGRLGFPDYALTNNNANMRRIRLRIEQLQQRPTESTEHEQAGVTVREDVGEGRIMLIFPGKPSEAIRSTLKGAGFKWSPTRGAWVRFLNDAGRSAARYVMTKIAEAIG